jgi:hypothetical protein
MCVCVCVCVCVSVSMVQYLWDKLLKLCHTFGILFSICFFQKRLALQYDTKDLSVHIMLALINLLFAQQFCETHNNYAKLIIITQNA